MARGTDLGSHGGAPWQFGSLVKGAFGQCGLASLDVAWVYFHKLLMRQVLGNGFIKAMLGKNEFRIPLHALPCFSTAAPLAHKLAKQNKCARTCWRTDGGKYVSLNSLRHGALGFSARGLCPFDARATHLPTDTTKQQTICELAAWSFMLPGSPNSGLLIATCASRAPRNSSYQV